MTLAAISRHPPSFLERDPDSLLAARFDWAYAAACVLAMSSANREGPMFFTVMAAAGGWALWSVRPANAKVGAWVIAIAAAAGLGYAGQLGLSRLQIAVIDFTGDLIVGDLNDPDPYRGTTAIGHIGELKQDDEIVLWLTPPSDGAMPTLLHRVVYDRYVNGNWRAEDARLVVRATDTSRTLVLGAGSTSDATVRAESLVRGQRAVLAVPREVVSLSIPSAIRVSTNRLGVIEAGIEPGFHRYEVTFNALAPGPEPDLAHDLALPRTERETIEAVASELLLRAGTPAEAIERVQAFFEQEFRYALYRPEQRYAGTPLSVFLTKQRYGHCEYFASATVLLLRVAGIPARYATGYAVQEWSPLEDAFVVRRRHAHAWALAYVDGAWRDVDTTPSVWLDEEADAASWLQPLGDLWSWGRRRVAKWRAAGELEARLGLLVAGVLGVVTLGWGWRTRSRWRRAIAGAGIREDNRPARPGQGSPFYALLAALEAAGRGRGRGEPSWTWIARLDGETRDAIDIGGLRELAGLHYRLRFSPTGLKTSELDRLREGVERWIAAFRASHST